jgi:hypothetical protein
VGFWTTNVIRGEWLPISVRVLDRVTIHDPDLSDAGLLKDEGFISAKASRANEQDG